MGLIDFNDMILAPRVVEIAHCLAYMIHSQHLNTEVDIFYLIVPQIDVRLFFLI